MNVLDYDCHKVIEAANQQLIKQELEEVNCNNK